MIPTPLSTHSILAWSIILFKQKKNWANFFLLKLQQRLSINGHSKKQRCQGARNTRLKIGN